MISMTRNPSGNCRPRDSSALDRGLEFHRPIPGDNPAADRWSRSYPARAGAPRPAVMPGTRISLDGERAHPVAAANQCFFGNQFETVRRICATGTKASSLRARHEAITQLAGIKALVCRGTGDDRDQFITLAVGAGAQARCREVHHLRKIGPPQTRDTRGALR